MDKEQIRKGPETMLGQLGNPLKMIKLAFKTHLYLLISSRARENE